MSNMKKLAMIGCGGIGSYHLDHFIHFNDIELVGFCDLILERAQNFVKIAGKGQAFTCYKEMYDTVKPDMVLIGIPPYAHGEIEFETIRRGIHMFVEKPVALDIELARKIRDAAAANNIITAVGFQCRYDNINEAAKKFVEENQIVFVDGSRVGGIPGVGWWKNKDLSGGQLVEQTIHQIDILRYLLGDAESVYSVASRGYVTEEECQDYCTDDLTSSIIRFKNGVACHMMTGCYSTNGASWDSKMTFGTKNARMDYILCSHVRIFGLADFDKAAAVAGTISGDGTQRRNENEQGIRYGCNVDFGTLCDRTFIDAVITGDASKIRSPYADAVKTLEIVLSCNKSIETGMPVVL